MTRDRLEHTIRAACDVSKGTELWVFGSQAILAEFPNAPKSLRASIEVDVQPKKVHERQADQKTVRAVGIILGVSCNYNSFGKHICNRFSRTVTVFLVEVRAFGPRGCGDSGCRHRLWIRFSAPVRGRQW